jgi:putative hydrolase of the HAD superfamily
MDVARTRAVFFDAGGTLIYLDRRFLVERLAGHGLVVDEAGFAAADRAATRHAVELMRTGRAGDDASRWRAYGRRLLTELGCGPLVMAQIGSAIRARHEAGLLWSYVEPGTIETLEQMRARGYRLAIVSNADGRVASFLARAGLADVFDAIIDSGEVGVEKPDPGIFRIACERVGVEPHEAVHIGDILEIDVVGARAAGVTPILFDPHDAFVDVECTRIGAIPELLDRFTGALRPAPPAACDADFGVRGAVLRSSGDGDRRVAGL